MLQKFPVHKKHAMNCNVLGLHQSHGKLKEWFGQVDQVVDLLPFNVSNLELRVFMITVVFVNDIS
jgi:hypothetical protein